MILRSGPSPCVRLPGGDLRITNGKARPWSDHDDALATEWLQRRGVACGREVAADAVLTVAREHKFHPVLDYLNSLAWDGKERIASFAQTYLGANGDPAYLGAVTRCLFVGAVARVMKPGCKVDNMTVLEGAQGTFKSRACETLFSPWFTDELPSLGTKDAQMQLAGVWGVEISELSAMRKAEVETVKSFISRRVDRYRPPYARHVIAVSRQCVFIGTTNADAYLKDETGGRRFWPIKCGKIKLNDIARDRDQIWAEALTRFNKSEQWWLTDAEAAAAATEQEARRQHDEWETLIDKYLVGSSQTSVGEVLVEVLSIMKDKWSQPDQNRVAKCLVALGWHSIGPRKIGGESVRLYRRNDDTTL